LNELIQESSMGVILITHDLGVVAEVCTRVVVMYLGQVVEEADVESLFENPLHPYTQGLMKAVPTIDRDRSEKLYVIKGMVPSLHHVPNGCRFAPRCQYADSKCTAEAPPLQEFTGDHKVRCWHYEKTIHTGGEA
jgi:peptide/nickel transport system ATP-binding protein